MAMHGSRITAAPPTAYSASSPTLCAQAIATMRDGVAAAASIAARTVAIGWFGRSIPGGRGRTRANGVAVGHAPTQMPQLVHRIGPTTASRSNAAPSLRGRIAIASNGQSSAQRRQPGQRREQGDRDRERGPSRPGAERVVERIAGEIKPIEVEDDRDTGEVGRGATRDRIDQRQHQQHRHRAGRKPARRVDPRPADPKKMGPQRKQQEQRQRDMEEYEQREQAVAHIRGSKKVACDRRAENPQPVEPFGGSDGDVLGQRIPNQPVAGDPGTIKEYENR